MRWNRHHREFRELLGNVDARLAEKFPGMANRTVSVPRFDTGRWLISLTARDFFRKDVPDLWTFLEGVPDRDDIVPKLAKTIGTGNGSIVIGIVEDSILVPDATGKLERSPRFTLHVIVHCGPEIEGNPGTFFHDLPPEAPAEAAFHLLTEKVPCLRGMRVPSFVDEGDTKPEP